MKLKEAIDYLNPIAAATPMSNYRKALITVMQAAQENSNKTKIRGFEAVNNTLEVVKLPKRSTAKSAGYDFYAPCDIKVPAHGTSGMIMTGVKAYMQDDEVLLLYIRSSLAVKKSLMLVNNVGVVDADYYNNPDNEGDIGLMFYNYSDIDRIIKAGERMAQAFL